jgi:phosphoglycerate dehydrogenase-like enzyme
MMLSCYLPTFMDPIQLLVISNPAASHLRLLDRLPEPVNIQVGNDIEFLESHAHKAEVILSGGLKNDLLRAAFLQAPGLRWVHVLWAGVEKLLFPELIESPVPLTNGRGVFKDGLGEFALASIFYFAKDVRRLVLNQEHGKWEQFDNFEVRGQVLGVVGYGGIGREAARLARAVGMKVLAVRKRTALAVDDPLVDRVYAPDQLHEMLALSDYVLVATPLTSETKGMIGEAELRAMKRSAVIINVGRGPVIVEPALIAALEQGAIKGAALDVFDIEPLPSGHPFYRLPNVLLSPHAADHTVGWADLAMHRFIDNFERFRGGQPLENVVDKKAGY